MQESHRVVEQVLAVNLLHSCGSFLNAQEETMLEALPRTLAMQQI